MSKNFDNLVYASREDREIAETTNEIEKLLDCFIDGTYKLFGKEFDKYKCLTVKLYRLKLKKDIKNSDADRNNYHSNYSIEGGYRI